jgi:hypothetical protein
MQVTEKAAVKQKTTFIGGDANESPMAGFMRVDISFTAVFSSALTACPNQHDFCVVF